MWHLVVNCPVVSLIVQITKLKLTAVSPIRVILQNEESHFPLPYLRPVMRIPPPL